MIKQIGVFQAKPGMTRDAFIDRYENWHAPFAMRHCPWLSDYRRNYPLDKPLIATAHLDTSKVKPKIDVVSEFKFKSQADADKVAAALSDPKVGQLFIEDEEKVFDRSKMTIVRVDEFTTPSEQLRPRPKGHTGAPAVKVLGLAKKRDPNLSRAAFMETYEAGLAKLVPRLLQTGGVPLYAGYRRNFPIMDSFENQGHISVPPPKPAFDTMTEIWFWTQADYRAFLELCADRKVGEALAAQQSRLFDTASIAMLLVEEHITPPERLAAALASYAA